MRKESDLSDFERDPVFGDRWVGLNISETFDLHIQLHQEKISSEAHFSSENALLMPEVRANKHSLQPSYAEEHLFTQALQHWMTEQRKNIARFEESPFKLQHLDGRVRIWH